MKINRRSRSVVSTALLGLTGGVGLGLAGATLGALLADWWWPLDLLTSFHPQYAAMLALVAMVHLVLRSPASGGWFLAAALINASIVAPYVVGGGDGTAVGEARLSILSFNVGVSNPMRGEIARYVDEEQPDLLFVIESSFEWEDALAAAGPPMAAVAIVPRGMVSGITVMADAGLLPRSVEVPFADLDEAAAVEVDLGTERIVVLVLHPPSPTSGERAARRNGILSAAGDWVATLDLPVVVVGDFNATPWSPAFRELQVRGGLADTARGRGLQPSWPSGWGPAMIPIDNALHSGGLVAVDRETGPSFDSAHRSLIVTVAPGG